MSTMELRPINSPSTAVLGDLTPSSVCFGRHIDPYDNMTGGRMVYSGDRHWIIFGPNGSGKTLRLLAPNLLQCDFRSYFAIDVKGQLAAITAAHRATVGPVYVINPFGVLTKDPRYPDMQSCGFNPLKKLDPNDEDEGFNAAAALLAEALIEVDQHQPHWGLSARSLVAMLIMFTVLEARGLLPDGVREITDRTVPPPRTPGIPTMGRVRQLIGMPSDGPADRNGQLGLGIPALALAVQRSGIDGLIDKAGQFTNWSKEKESIVSVAQAQTEFLDDPPIRKDLEKDGPDFATLKDIPSTVYLILPPKMIGRHGKWLRLLVSSALQDLMVPPQPGQPPTLFMLDEMAALGHMEVIQSTFALVRDFKIQMACVYQNMQQLKDVYSKQWETFIANSGVVTSFATGDSTTAEWFSIRAGEVGRNLESTNFSRSVASHPLQLAGAGVLQALFGLNKTVTESESTSVTPTKTRLAHAHSLYGMAKGATVNFIENEPDIVLGFAPLYVRIKQCDLRGRENPYRAAVLPFPGEPS